MTCGNYLESLGKIVKNSYRNGRRPNSLAFMLEELHCALMLFSGGARAECSKILTLAGLGIFLANP
jgi:hypothetical protein